VSYSRASCSADSDQLVGHAGHGRDHDSNLVAGVALALDASGDVSDAIQVGNRSAAKLHHDT
jgi:hypothetical protein